MRQKTGCGVALAAALAFAILPAAADMPAGTISAFNQALQTGDAAVIVEAAKVLGANAVAHPEDRQAPVAAFEAANQLCLLNGCAEAVPMAGFLGGLDDAALPVSRAEVEVLAAFAGWSASAKDKAADAAFGDVLEANAGISPSALTLAAYEYYCAAIIGSDDWKAVRRRAGLAGKHMMPVRDAVPYRWATVALLSSSALFNDEQSTDALQEVVDVETWLLGKRPSGQAGDTNRAYFRAMAWHRALMAYFRTAGGRDFKIAQKIDAKAEKALEEAHPDGKAESSETAPLCDGHVVSPPKPTYPRRAARKGYVGAVVLSFDFVDGEPANYRVLASVPDGEFEQVSLEGMRSFKWEWDQEQENPDCTKSKTEVAIYPFEYILR
ncbi:MAG TPA: energy transducer TonB [Hyphomonas sp.]|nr:energy transducer TonB [Hyphomonas sp.]